MEEFPKRITIHVIITMHFWTDVGQDICYTLLEFHHSYLQVAVQRFYQSQISIPAIGEKKLPSNC